MTIPKKREQFRLIVHGKQQGSLLTVMMQNFQKYPVYLSEIDHQELYGNIRTIYTLESEETFSLEEWQTTIEESLRDFQITLSLERVEIEEPRTQENQYYILTVLSSYFSVEALQRLLSYLEKSPMHITAISPLDRKPLHVFEIKLCSPQPIERQQFMSDLLTLKTRYEFDLALHPDTLFRRNKRLIVLDADMTFIQCEIINELSRMVGKEKEVQEITELAMNGELEFQEALRKRVSMLKGVTIHQMAQLAKSIPYTKGVARLIQVLKTLGYKIALVSGGFTYFIEQIQQEFALDYGFANTLEIKDGVLTGEVIGEIVDGRRKATITQEIAQKENISLEQVIAIGDGANDLQMLSCVGMGIAFNAKQFLQERVTGSLSQPNLDAILYFLGISSQELAIFDQ